MKTATERLQFVIRFAQMDLDTLRPGDWLNLREDLMTFMLSGGEEESWEHEPGRITRLVSRGGIIAMPMEGPIPQTMPETDIKALQTETRAILYDLIESRQTMQALGQHIEIRARYSICSLDGIIPVKGRNILTVTGATRDIFLLALYLLLLQDPANSILRCPECRTIFYRIGKQQYCSRTCSNRANVRTWRQREEVKAQEREQAHRRYKDKRTAGGKVKITVGRNPRKHARHSTPQGDTHAETPRES